MNPDRLILILACLAVGNLLVACRAPQKKITVTGEGGVGAAAMGWPAPPSAARPATQRPLAPSLIPSHASARWPATVTVAPPARGAGDGPVGRVDGTEPVRLATPREGDGSAGLEEESRQRRAEPARPTGGETETVAAPKQQNALAGSGAVPGYDREGARTGSGGMPGYDREDARTGSGAVPGRDGEVGSAMKLFVGATTLAPERGEVEVLGVPAMGVAGGEGSRRVERPIALPSVGASVPAVPVMESKPIYIEPILEPVPGVEQWRAWQAARQRAAAEARQAEREELRRSLQDWLRR